MFKPRLLTVLIGSLIASGVAFADTVTTTNVGKIDVQGQAVGAGQIVAEDSDKARSQITRSAIDNALPTESPYQLIDMLPGVNATSQDATGLFGGTLSIRGFNSDQIGFTIDGAPVNDSGNYAVYPQEYVDSENLEQIFVTQGSTDTDAPHIGATGGNIGIVSSNPKDYFRIKGVQTFGQLNMYKTFARLDTGKLFNDTTTAYFSVSKSAADKWRGDGKADRTHIDAKIVSKLSPGNQVSLGILYNDATNNFFKRVTKSQYDKGDYNYDYATTFPGRLTPVNGAAQDESKTVNGVSRSDYYALQVNPFRNALVTLNGSFQLANNLRLDISPYYWYGYGNGSFGTYLKEGGTGVPVTQVRDLNGDGDTLDNVLMYRSSVTKTHRPGITTKLNWQNDVHKVVLGLWYERADHKQTQPVTGVDASGHPISIWGESAYALDGNGNIYQGRNYQTITTVVQPFIMDTMTLADDRLKLNVGIRMPHTTRQGTNYPSAGRGLNNYYEVSRTYNEVLPSVGATYFLTPEQSIFGNVTKNFRAPANYTLFDPGRAEDILPETSTNIDLGYRYDSKFVTASATAFYVNYKNRQAYAIDENGIGQNYNVGNVHTKGLELEAGTKPINGFSVYGSLTYTDAVTASDYVTYVSGKQIVVPTSGKHYVNTPKWLAAVDLNYQQGRFFGNFKTRYTGLRYSTVLNDESIPGYITNDLSVGYKFADAGYFKNPTLRFNVSNLFDRKYLNSIEGTTVTALGYQTYKGSAPTYMPAAPRFASITFSADFQ